MRDRVESGRWMFLGYGALVAVSWWWHGQTSASSTWWTISLLAIGVGALGMCRGAVLFLSGFSGFGRNFHEERESVAIDPDDQGVALNTETEGALIPPMLLLILGSIAAVLLVFPATNSLSWEFREEPWVSPRALPPLVLVTGIAALAWSGTLRAMMRSGPDRWTHVAGTRDEIRKATRSYMVWGATLIVIALAHLITTG